jgi:probable HAF family extracellular repeat protein
MKEKNNMTRGARRPNQKGNIMKFTSLTIALGLAACVAPNARSGPPTFTTIDVPGALFTDCVGINRFGDIVGHYIDATGSHGYLFHKGSFATIDFPGGDGGHAHAINSSGAIVGEYFSFKTYHGYVLIGGAYSSIEFPGAHSTRANGINTAGDIVGSHFDNNNDSTGGSNGSKAHGFLLRDGVFSSIDFPGADYTDAWAINDNGQVVGRYKNGNGDFHVFLYTIATHTFVSIDYPNSVETAMGDFSQMGGLNNNGDIASVYCNSSSSCELASFGSLHGFVLSRGSFSSFDVPGAAATVPFGINDQGVVVGGYTDANLRVHGFIKNP